jgi:hypothetical protein
MQSPIGCTSIALLGLGQILFALREFKLESSSRSTLASAADG